MLKVEGGKGSPAVSGSGGKSDKQDTTKVVSCLATHRLGLPLVGSPLCCLSPRSLRRARSKRPTSLWRGEGHMWVDGRGWGELGRWVVKEVVVGGER